MNWELHKHQVIFDQQLLRDLIQDFQQEYINKKMMTNQEIILTQLYKEHYGVKVIQQEQMILHHTFMVEQVEESKT